MRKVGSDSEPTRPQNTEAPGFWVPGASLRGAGDKLGLVAGDANKSMTTYGCLNSITNQRKRQ